MPLKEAAMKLRTIALATALERPRLRQTSSTTIAGTPATPAIGAIAIIAGRRTETVRERRKDNAND